MRLPRGLAAAEVFRPVGDGDGSGMMFKAQV